MDRKGITPWREDMENGGDMGFSAEILANNVNDGNVGDFISGGFICGNWLVNANDIISVSLSGLEDLNWSRWAGVEDNVSLGFWKGDTPMSFRVNDLMSADEFFASGATLK
ncbi:MAG: hypothetical protein J6X38_02590, partial [Abditibacteriota bacterium]|nr:hypothetical protein [Abditibacteriota bacterium]